MPGRRDQQELGRPEVRVSLVLIFCKPPPNDADDSCRNTERAKPRYLKQRPASDELKRQSLRSLSRK